MTIIPELTDNRVSSERYCGTCGVAYAKEEVLVEKLGVGIWRIHYPCGHYRETMDAENLHRFRTRGRRRDKWRTV